MQTLRHHPVLITVSLIFNYFTGPGGTDDKVTDNNECGVVLRVCDGEHERDPRRLLP